MNNPDTQANLCRKHEVKLNKTDNTAQKKTQVGENVHVLPKGKHFLFGLETF
jgi:hypothetical protein